MTEHCNTNQQIVYSSFSAIAVQTRAQITLQDGLRSHSHGPANNRDGAQSRVPPLTRAPQPRLRVAPARAAKANSAARERSQHSPRKPLGDLRCETGARPRLVLTYDAAKKQDGAGAQLQRTGESDCRIALSIVKRAR